MLTLKQFQEDQVIYRTKGKVIYRDGETVLKVFDDSFTKSGILNEALNQARIEETGLKVPRVLEVLKIEDHWAIRSDFIPGETLESMMRREPAKESEYLERFVDIQIDIFAHEAVHLNVLKEKMRRRIDESSFDATTRYELQTRLASLPTHKKICHGDFNPSNIIITPDDEAYVLDWSHVTQGNASADAALTYMLFHLAGKPELANKYLKRFCLKTDTARQYVQRWMPIVAASQSTKNKPEEREFLHRWVDVAEYQ